MTTWLAFDIGTTGTKAALIDDDGNVSRRAYRAYPTHTSEGGMVEQDSRDWWRAACDTAKELHTPDIEAIVITGQMQNVILVDKDRQPVRPVILYSDTRAHAQAADLNSRIMRDVLRQVTGNDQEAGSLIAKLRWLEQHEPESLKRAATMLTGAADYIALHLTGSAASDTTTASTTGLMKLDSREWWRDISGEIDLMPRLVPGGTQIGVVLNAAAQAMNVKSGVPVYLAPGDAGAATLGAGSGEPGSPYAYIGTSGWVAYTSAQRASPEHGVFTLVHPAKDKYICVAPLLTAGGNFDWIKAVFGAESHHALIDTACARLPGCLVYLPYLNGERSPFSDPFARGAFIGLSTAHTQADMARAVLEGVAFAYRHALDALVAGTVVRMVLTGGGTRSKNWCQMLADICGVELSIAGDAANTGLRGSVLAARVARGELKNYLPEQDFPVEAKLSPDDRYRRHYDRQYALFREAYPALKSLFARMQEQP